MEAEAIYSFEASSSEELSFRKGDLLKVLNTVDDVNWYTARLGPKLGMVPWNYIKLRENDWYYGAISRADAERLLEDKHQGAFLVRASECLRGTFSLSLKCSTGVQHFKVHQSSCGKFYLWAVKFNSLNEMVEYYRSVSISRFQEITLRDMQKTFLAKAVYDFIAREANELEFCQGDIITVIDCSHEDWWEGKSRSRRGHFPASYVKPMLC